MSDEKPFNYQEAQSQDQMLYDEWKQNPNKKTMGRLVHQMNPLIYNEVRKLSGSLPTEALAAESKKWAIHAIKTYNPNKGASIGTHVSNYLMKTKRLNYQYQNSARLPEDQQLQYHAWNKAHSDLEAELNRDPTDKEMAKRLGWEEKRVQKYKGLLYADHYESGAERPTDMYQYDEDKIRFKYVVDNLDEQEKFLLYNAKEMPAADLAKKLNMNINQLNYSKKKLRQKIEELQGKIGYFR